MTLERAWPWVLRAVWIALPVTAGPALADGLAGRSDAVQLAAGAGLWLMWAAVVVATLALHPIGLTLLRVVAPAAVVAVVVAGEPTSIGVASTALVVVIAFAPDTATLFVNGLAYPNERRFPLRVPAALLLGPVVLAWAVVVAGPAAAVLLLAAKAWIAGIATAVIGIPVAAVLARALHGLARRWVVFVPAGVVLHDPMTLADPVLFPKRVVASIGPAPTDTDALDLSQGALGLVLLLDLGEKVPMVLTRRRVVEPGASARLLFSPTRPGAVLAEARRRGLTTSD